MYIYCVDSCVVIMHPLCIILTILAGKILFYQPIKVKISIENIFMYNSFYVNTLRNFKSGLKLLHYRKIIIEGQSDNVKKVKYLEYILSDTVSVSLINEQS